MSSENFESPLQNNQIPEVPQNQEPSKESESITDIKVLTFFVFSRI